MCALPQPLLNPEIKYTQLFIDNKFVTAKDGTTFSVVNPSNGKELCKVSEAKEADVDVAVEAAKKAFEPKSEWRKMALKQRAHLLNKVADLIERDRAYLATLESMNNGKVYSRVYLGDIQMVIDVFRYFAGWTDKLVGETIPVDEGFFAYTKNEPIGVCGAIIPWNVPLIMLAWKTAPCLAAGNTLVLKPAELTPLTALYIASLIKEAGFPAGVFNVVPGFGNIAGSALSHHMDVGKISFTGSTAVGRLVQKAAADSNFKKVTLEMGGKSPNIIFPDADIDYAVEMAHTAIFSHGGQICCAGARTFVHEDIYDEFVKKSIERAKSRTIGDAMDLKVEQGPQISKAQQDKILRLIEEGTTDGACLRCGGGKMEELGGFYVQPTVITDLKDDMLLAKEEVEVA
ncbi:unnamed protein product [Clavelina lepadiformis]|uniref:Aldehyde dehydrogenase domain-containing protein n=1 Tax=Clavelina lepadiformis TaxID=159417 RepID=A0ABP0H3K2_CLALP